MQYTINVIANRHPVTRYTLTAVNRAAAMQSAADLATADGLTYDNILIVTERPEPRTAAAARQTDRAAAASDLLPMWSGDDGRPLPDCNQYLVILTTAPTAADLLDNPDAQPVADYGYTYAPTLSAAYAAAADMLENDRMTARCLLVPDDLTALDCAVNVARAVTSTLVRTRCRPMDFVLYKAAHVPYDRMTDHDARDLVATAALAIAEGMQADGDDVAAMYDRAYAAVNQYMRQERGLTSLSLEHIRDCMTMTRRNIREMLGMTRGDAAAARRDVDALTAPAADDHIDDLTADVIDTALATRLAASLTPRQRRVLDLYLRGLSARRIRDAIGAKDVKSVTQHIRAIRKHAADLIDAPAYADRAATLTAATAAADQAEAAALAACIAYANTANAAAVAAAARAGIAYQSTKVNHDHWTAANRRAAARRTIDAAAAVLTQYAAAVSTADHQTVSAAREAAAAADRAAQSARLDAVRLRRAADRTRLDVRARADRAAMAGLTAAAAADRAAIAARTLTGYRRLLNIAAQTAADAHAAARAAVRSDRLRAAHAAAQTAAHAAYCAHMISARAAAAARDLTAAADAARAAAADLDVVALNARAALTDAARTGYRAEDAQTAATAAADARRARRRAAAAAAVPADAAQTAAVARAHARLAADLVTRR